MEFDRRKVKDRVYKHSGIVIGVRSYDYAVYKLEGVDNQLTNI